MGGQLYNNYTDISQRPEAVVHECSEDITKGLKAGEWLLFIIFI